MWNNWKEQRRLLLKVNKSKSLSHWSFCIWLFEETFKLQQTNDK
jgi:hypothetical protein